ncbi:MAG: DUF1501 domain-containing protein [Planctomycetota bacterium]
MKHGSQGPTRRSILVNGVRLSALGALAPHAFTGPGRGDGAQDDRVLVVLQLTGGNDGLNTVAPHGQDAYYRLRPTLAHAPKSVHRLDEQVGLHPGLGRLAGLAKDGLLTVVHGVGHPAGDRSHFRSLEIWHTAEPYAPVGRVGWLGNLADQLLARDPGSLPALSVGGRSSSLSMRGARATPPVVPDDRGFKLSHVSRQIGKERGRIAQARAGAPSELDFMRRTARIAYDAAERMSAITAQEPAVEYPNTSLGKELRLVAQLVRGGFGTRIFHVSFGGFDTHASQESVHGALLGRVDAALGAFQRDLVAAGLQERVTTFVFSEFGRRARENGSRGTDHGKGAPVLLLGGALPGGQLGRVPDLAHLDDGDVPVDVDFRGVYRQLEEDWLGLKSFSKQRIDAPRLFG